MDKWANDPDRTTRRETPVRVTVNTPREFLVAWDDAEDGWVPER